MNYGKTKDSQMKFDALIDKIEWLVSIASYRITRWYRMWVDLVNKGSNINMQSN